MKKAFIYSLLLGLIFTGCKNLLRLGDIMDGPGMENEEVRPIPLEQLAEEWKGRTIIVHDGDSLPDLPTLLKAFNEIWETRVVDTLFSVISTPDFEGFYASEDGSGFEVQTLYARAFPYVYVQTQKEGDECMEACTAKRDNGHTLLIIKLGTCRLQGNQPTPDSFYYFYDYNPDTQELKPEAEPWAQISPVAEGSMLRPSFDLFDSVFTMGEYAEEKGAPTYCHTFEFDGQNIVYTGYQAEIPEDFDDEK